MKRIAAAFLSCALLAMLTMPVFAEDISGSSGVAGGVDDSIVASSASEDVDASQSDASQSSSDITASSQVENGGPEENSAADGGDAAVQTDDDTMQAAAVQAPYITAVSVAQASIATVPATLTINVELEDPAGTGIVGLYFGYDAGNGRDDFRPEITSPIFTTTKKSYSFTFELDKYCAEGQHVLTFLGINTKNADVQYTIEGATGEFVGRSSIDNSEVNRIAYAGEADFTIHSSPEGDNVPPLIQSIRTVDKSLDAPGKLCVEMEIEEADSGVAHVQLGYGQIDGDMGFDMQLSVMDTESFIHEAGTNRYTFYFDVPATAVAAEYELTFMSATDVAGNDRQYGSVEGDNILTNFQTDPVDRTDAGFTVTSSSNTDSTSPQLISVAAESAVQTAPTLMRLNMEVLEEGSGISSIYFAYIGPDGTRLDLFSPHFEVDGTHVSVLAPIHQYAVVGSYRLDFVGIMDAAGNDAQYGYYPDEQVFRRSTPWDDTGAYDVAYNGEADFEVQSDVVLALLSSTSNPSIASQLAALQAGDTALVDYTDSPAITAEMFLALAGRDVTVVFQSGGIQWVVNGLDIDPEKAANVDLFVTSEVVPGDDYGLDEDVQRLVFPENGELPGKITMRILLDYTFYTYGISSELKLLYWDGSGLELQTDRVGVEADGYASFPITHNSTFLIAADEAVRDKQIPVASQADPNSLTPSSSVPTSSSADTGATADTNNTGGATGNTGGTVTTTGAPQTSDNSPASFWVLVGAAALAGACWIGRRRIVKISR